MYTGNSFIHHLLEYDSFFTVIWVEEHIFPEEADLYSLVMIQKKKKKKFGFCNFEGARRKWLQDYKKWK